jgi:hypothetical protein
LIFIHGLVAWPGGVRVCLKMCREFGLEVADLSVQFGDDADCSAGAGPERSGDRGGRGELLAAQHFQNLERSGVEVALSPSSFECRSALRQAQALGDGAVTSPAATRPPVCGRCDGS